MAVAQIYNAMPGDTITAARWNNEFGNIYDNGTDIAFPLTKAVSLAGYTLTFDATGGTSMVSSTSNALLYSPGNKSGTPNSTGKIFNTDGSTYTDSATAGSGTATLAVFTAFQQPTLAAANVTVTTTDAATVYIQNAPANGTNETITNPWALWIDNGGLRTDGYLGGTVALGGHIYGLTYLPGTDAVNDILLSVGGAVSDDAAAANKRLMTLTSAFEKRSDATWVVGTNQGMLDTGAVGNNDYYLWLIMRPDTGVVDMLCSLSSTAPTMPTSYTFKRLVGWFKRTGGTIVAFHTYELEGGGLHFLWDSPTLDVDLATTLTTSERTDAAKVPLNISTVAQLNISAEDAAATSCIYMYCPDLTSIAPSATVAPLATTKAQVANVELEHQVEIRTDATGLIAAQANVATYDDYSFATLGFKWSRR